MCYTIIHKIIQIVKMVTQFRMFHDEKLVSQEKSFVDECNEVKHKLIVTKYLSGDDRDHWYLKCTKCDKTIDYHFSWDQPYLNYCPHCSPPEELNQFSEDEFDTDAYTGRQIPCVDFAPNTPEYVDK